MDEVSTTKNGVSRRTMIKGAAWSVPVIAVAAAAPMAAASVGNATVAWDGTRTSLLTINLLSGGTINAAVGLLPSFPNNVVLQNGTGTLNGPLTGLVTITWASGLPVSLLSSGVARGFGVTSIPGATLGARTITQKTILDLAPIATLGVNETSQPFTLTAASLAGGAQQILGQIAYGATNRSGVAVSVAMTFNVTVTLFSNGTQIGSPAVAQITVPAGAGVL